MKKSLWVAAVALTGLSSCLSSGRNSYTFSALGVVQRHEHDSSRWWFMADDSATLVAANSFRIPQDLHRAIMYMEWSSDLKQLDGYSSTVNFLDFARIPVYPVTAAGLHDSAPNDPVRVSSRFLTLQYLNIAAVFDGSKDSEHTFLLLRDSLQADSPVRLLFRHNRGNDVSYQPMERYMSFDLETLAERGTQDTVRLRLILPGADSIDFTYRFCR